VTDLGIESSSAFPAVRGDVAIIGMACTYPGARNLGEFWDNVVHERDCTSEVDPQRWDPDIFFDPDPTNLDRVYCKRGGYLPPRFAFNPLRYGTMPKAVTGAEPDQFLVLRCVHEAMEDAGYTDRPIDGRRTSFVLGRGNYLGAGLAGILQRGQLCEQTLRILAKVQPDLSARDLQAIKEAIRGHVPSHGPETAPGLIPNISSGRVANRLDLMGPNFCVDAACASSLIATELAVRDLLTGRCDLVLAGGVHIFTGVPFLQVFAAMGALSQTGVIRPFDRDSDGTLSGEGVGVLVLKRLGDAVADGDRIYAVIKGVGTSSDGRAMSVAAPRVEGEELAMRRALEMSGIDPQTLGMIECHGTGTPIGDPAEVEAMHRVLGLCPNGPPTCAIGSIKSNIGHAMPAAGAAGLIKTALSLYHGVLPATLNCRQPLGAIAKPGSRLYVNTRTRPWIHGRTDAPRRAGVSAFGFGGINAHVLLEEYAAESSRPDVRRATTRSAARAGNVHAVTANAAPTLLRDWDCEVVIVEADTAGALATAAHRLRDYACSVDRVPLRDIAFTCNTSLTGRACRLAVVAETPADLAGKLDRAAQRFADPACRQIKDTKGIYYFGDSPIRHGKLAFLFPGEGAQYVNMLSDLCIHFPEVRGCFEAADRAVHRPDRIPPSADIFPPPFFSDDDRLKAEARLWEIERATEAVLTADGAIFSLLAELSVTPDMLAGHSAGEWIALAAAGVVDIDELVGSMDRLDSMYRSLSGNTSIPRMAMLAVGAGRDKVLELVAEIDRRVHIANDNCPHQVVIVTSSEDAEPVTKHLRARGVFVEKLPYDRGYHTPAFTYICEPLREYFSALKIRPHDKLLFSCTTAEPYPTNLDQVLNLVSNTFARPLRFRETVEAMYAEGARIFLEVGPRGNLTAFVDDILRGRPHAAIATDLPRRSGTAGLNHALGLLASLHVPMDLAPLYRRRDPRRLAFDLEADRRPDPDAAPGTMQVSICYPALTLDKIPPSLEPVVARKAVPETPSTEPGTVPPPGQSASEAVAARHVTDAAQRRTPPPTKDQTAPSGAASGVIRQHLQMMETFLETQEAVMRTYLGTGAAPTATTHDAGVPVPAEPLEPPARPETDGVALEATDARPGGHGELGESAGAAATETAGGQKANVGRKQLQELLISIVSGKTGYPPEMLDLDADMEADLGIDSIKRIEILGALQETGNGTVSTDEVDLEQVAKLKSLRAVLDFLDGAAIDTPEGAPSLRPEPGTSSGHASQSAALPLSGRVLSHTPGREVVIQRRIDLAEDIYLLDHCLDPRASDHEPPRHALPVLPLTVSVEMMAEAAALLRPGARVVGMQGVQASKWIDLDPDTKRASILITARAGSSAERVDVTIHPHDESQPTRAPTGSAYAVGTAILADNFPAAPPQPCAPLRNPRPPSHTAQQMYEQRRMFHGPRFQGVASLDEVGDDGLVAQIEVLPLDNLLRSNASPSFIFDPFLLDAAGQLVGYWPVEYLAEGFVLFPIKVARLTRYRDNLEPGERAACRLFIREVSQRQLRADLDIVAPDGRLWMRIEGWEDWRFYWAPGFYDFWRFPNKGALSEPLRLSLPSAFDDVECRRLTPSEEMRLSIWENLWVRVILSRRELEQYHGLHSDKRRKEWLYGRAAAKDAVRLWLKRHYRRDVYPADIEILTDAGGRPTVSGPGLGGLAEVPQVSISHKGMTAVAAAGRRALGIDLELIQDRDTGFEEVAFTPNELELLGRLNGEDRNEWLTRAWCAKEAASKVMGLGFSNGPSTMVVTGVEATPGALVIACGEALRRSAPEVGNRAFVVHSVRDGDAVIALAVDERNGDAPA
jgi:acyl transferase domain-containing protein/phosphopantetheinyl transferase (holo-ACP synthase)/acyl carrier protein